MLQRANVSQVSADAMSVHTHAWRVCRTGRPRKRCVICGLRSSQGEMNPVSVEATAVPAVERELVPGQRWAGGGSETPPVPLPCPGWKRPCGTLTPRRLCYFCTRSQASTKGKVHSYARGTHYPEPRADGRCSWCLGPLRSYPYRGGRSYRHVGNFGG